MFGFDGVVPTAGLGAVALDAGISLTAVLRRWLLSQFAKKHRGKLPKSSEEEMPIGLIMTLIKPALELIWGTGVKLAASTLSDRLHNSLWVA